MLPRRLLPLVVVATTALIACGSERVVPTRSPERGAPAARIVCDGRTTRVATPLVETTPAGVDFLVEVPVGSDVGFAVRGVGGRNVDGGRFVMLAPPGRIEVACISKGRDPGDDSLYRAIRVIDPDGNYLSPEPACRDAQGVGIADAPARPGDPEDQTRDIVRGIRSGDVVQRAGYRESRERAIVRIVRAGEVVAAAEFEHAGAGWAFTSLTSCPDAGISL